MSAELPPRDVVDLDRLVAWMDAQGLGSGPIEDAHLLGGGTQNILLRFRRGERGYVLRRGPVHKRANSDETLRREARVLRALAGSDVPHPGLIGAHGDLDVIGAAFTLMEPIDGFNATVELPEPHASDLAIQRDMGLSMADAIAALGASTSTQPASPTWARRTVGSSGRWSGGVRTWRRMRASRGTRGRRSRASTRWPHGSTRTGP
jgi:aminoglycoside phosphotransferase (APT) family kinase protein